MFIPNHPPGGQSQSQISSTCLNLFYDDIRILYILSLSVNHHFIYNIVMILGPQQLGLTYIFGFTIVWYTVRPKTCVKSPILILILLSSIYLDDSGKVKKQKKEKEKERKIPGELRQRFAKEILRYVCLRRNFILIKCQRDDCFRGSYDFSHYL